MDEGTGIVQMAPGFGEDDQRACEAAGIPVVCPVDDRGRFTAEVGDLAGVQVFDANATIVDRLGAAGALVRAEDYTHSYPHCWRTDTPLIYRAMSSWFVARDGHQRTAWSSSTSRSPGCPSTSATVPSASGWRGRGTGRSAGTVSGGRRSRCGRATTRAYPRVDVYGSIDELAADFGVRPDDLHRPFIDELTRPNPDDPTGGSTMRRIPDVLDCWFDSGLHALRAAALPLRARQEVRGALPGRLHRRVRRPDPGLVLHLARARRRRCSTGPLSRPASRTASCSATTAGSSPNGCATSPTPRRCSPPTAPTPCGGTCSARRCCAATTSSSRRRGWPSRIRLVCNPIWNTWYFLSMYANADGLAGTGPDRPDRRARPLRPRQDAPARRGRHGGHGQLRPRRRRPVTSRSFLDALTNWYVRRSRDRFWRPVNAGARPRPPGSRGAPPDDKQDAYDTLHTVLEVLCRVAAPFLPFLTEAVYKGLTGRAQRAPRGRGRTPTSCRRTPTSSRPWTSPERCARPATRSARRPGAGHACRCRH